MVKVMGLRGEVVFFEKLKPLQLLLFAFYIFLCKLTCNRRRKCEFRKCASVSLFGRSLVRCERLHLLWLVFYIFLCKVTRNRRRLATLAVTGVVHTEAERHRDSEACCCCRSCVPIDEGGGVDEERRRHQRVINVLPVLPLPRLALLGRKLTKQEAIVLLCEALELSSALWGAAQVHVDVGVLGGNIATSDTVRARRQGARLTRRQAAPTRGQAKGVPTRSIATCNGGVTAPTPTQVGRAKVAGGDALRCADCVRSLCPTVARARNHRAADEQKAKMTEPHSPAELEKLKDSLAKEKEKAPGNLRKLMAALKTNTELEKEVAKLKEQSPAPQPTSDDGDAAALEEARRALQAEVAARQAAEKAAQMADVEAAAAASAEIEVARADAAAARAAADTARAEASAAQGEAAAARDEAAAARDEAAAARADAEAALAQLQPSGMGSDWLHSPSSDPVEELRRELTASREELAVCQHELSASRTQLSACEGELSTCRDELECEQARCCQG